MRTLLIMLTGLAVLTPVPSRASDAPVEKLRIGEAVEKHLGDDINPQLWVEDPERVRNEQGDQLEMRETAVEGFDTIRLANLVEPIRFASGVAQIPPATVQALSDTLARMRDRRNVRLHLVGHADNQPLSASLAAVFVDNAGLSRERAGQVAEYFKQALDLPAEAISFAWKGESQPIASNDTAAGRALNRRVEVEVWYDEARQGVALEEFLVPHQIERVKVCRMDTLCKLRYVDGHAQRARLKNLVPPLQYDDTGVVLSDDFIQSVRSSLASLADKQNVVVKLIGHTDSVPLSGSVERIYGDHLGLSRARARRAALAMQEALALPTAAVQSDGAGDARPVASNNNADGRARNRRIEAEFWYDDPLQDLPETPQRCPEDAGSSVVTRVYDPPWGELPDIVFTDGDPVVAPGYTAVLKRALSDVADKAKPRLRFVGYTRNERLARRTAGVYGDDIGLSASRARRAMEAVSAVLPPSDAGYEFEGRGYVHADDVVTSGFTAGDTSHVAVQVIYDELAILDDYEGVDVTRITRELSPRNPLGLNLMRITVDGVPLNDPQRSSADIQRCTDVALHAADIQLSFDNLRSRPRLAVAASPARLQVSDGGTYTPIAFRMYANYWAFLERAEIRVFANQASLQSEPLAVVEIDPDTTAVWQPGPPLPTAPGEVLAYVLRVYGPDGHFDETVARPLAVVAAGNDAVDHQPDTLTANQLLTRYGENDLAVRNVRLGSGTVTVRGHSIPQGHRVLVAGHEVPVDRQGRFVAEEILPAGLHTVEVAVLDEQGRGELYLRDLELKRNDWFWAGMADVTIAANQSSGAVERLQGGNAPQDLDSGLDGRLAFFVQGEFGRDWSVTAGADSREGPVGDIVSNFFDKSPRALFRRIDTDYYYPEYGDDSVVEELTPTMGRLFLRLARGEDYLQWGNMDIAYSTNELGRVDRGLYGANLHLQSDQATVSGERRMALDAFVAEPGTLAGRDEFRGTGGSLYHLQRQDILPGSERIRIEYRDKVTGSVSAVRHLVAALDYDIDYLQGRVLLTRPLGSTATDNLLVRSSSLSGDAAHLVVRYEFAPGFDELNALSAGAQAHWWAADQWRLGLTTHAEDQDAGDGRLHAADLTWRHSHGTWVKLQHATRSGRAQVASSSADGGYGFDTANIEDVDGLTAAASRLDVSIDSGDFIAGSATRVSLYTQQLEAGYFAPGLSALSETTLSGASLHAPIGQHWSLAAQYDQRKEELGWNSSALELNATYRWGDHWTVSGGYRSDTRRHHDPVLNGGRRGDAAMQLGYDAGKKWNGYLFAQQTLSRNEDRQANSRFGFGGAYQVTTNLDLSGELSFGDLGTGGRLATRFAVSADTDLYLNYAVGEDQDRDVGAGHGRDGNLVAGVRSRLADSASVFIEERYQHNHRQTGLTHATGISFNPTQGWSLGLSTDVGTLQDLATGSETDRVASSLNAGYSSDRLRLSSGIEYRDDAVVQPDVSSSRNTWLWRNSLRLQLTPSARVVGKLNHSDSDSSLGTFYDGGFTEAVLGFAYRPVAHDRLNSLVKYTYFYNVPTTDQLGLQNLPGEYIQKSHVAAIDANYRINGKWSLGGKYAYRLGQVSLDRNNPAFFDNNASLYIIRSDLVFGRDWELLLEGRMLEMADLGERRGGVLATLSRYVGKHVKIGLGYNFTDFSDDLTDLSFDHRGVFLNITGTL